MTAKPHSQSPDPDPDMKGVMPALLRAAQRARELARQTGTGVAVMIDGELRILSGEELDDDRYWSDRNT